MKKYALLNYLFKNPEGATAEFLSEKMHTSAPNIYTYLKELRKKGFVKKIGKNYVANQSSSKVKKLVLLREAVPKDYLPLISPKTESIIKELAGKQEVLASKAFGPQNISRIKKLHALRIVLITKGKPVKVALRINEPITKVLLDYFEIKPAINAEDYAETLQSLKKPKKPEPAPEKKAPDEEVKKMCDEHFNINGDWFLDKAEKYAPDGRAGIQLSKIDEVTKQHSYYLKNLPEATRAEILTQWDYKYTYNTNKIEGNPLTLAEVKNYITTGTAPKYASRKDLNETINTADALKWVRQNAGNDIDENALKTLNYFIEKNIDETAGNYKRVYNLVGNKPTTPPDEVPGRMRSLMKWHRENKHRFHPFILASIMHQQFVMIHPFFDGNGRAARLLFNWVLMKNGHYPLIFEADTRARYYQAIENKSISQFIVYASTLYIEQYLKQ